jgi:methylenetetrahydrofolate reductase (NADPH)
MLKLRQRLPKLKALKPAFISVTYGAFGTVQERTLEIALLVRELGIDVAHHLTCVGSGRQEITRTVEKIQAVGIENIVALRGDPPVGSSEFLRPKDGFRYACELVSHLRGMGRMGIAVAGYPEKHVEAGDLATDIRHLRNKVDMGADAVITQLFYDNSSYFDFVERCRAVGIRQPIVPGLMPILNLQQIQRITGLCGATIPKPLLARLEAAGDDDSQVLRIGIEHTVAQARELLARGVPGIHFYVLNRDFHIAEIIGRLS